MARGGKTGGEGGGGGRGGRDRGPVSRETQISKKMSSILRHNAEEEGLKLDDAGFLNLADLLNNRQFKSMKVTFDEVRQVVQNNDKQRFTMVPISSSSPEDVAQIEASGQSSAGSNDPKDYLIRANQGHSLKVESEGLLKPITPETASEIVVHGTTHAAWTLIASSGGLKPMSRNHIHFASGLPAGFKSVVDLEKDTIEAPVISGMRKSSTVLIYVDLPKAMSQGIKFWLSDNGVILTEGNQHGVLPLDCFKRVEDRKGEGILLEDGKIVKEAPESWAPKAKSSS